MSQRVLKGPKHARSFFKLLEPPDPVKMGNNFPRAVEMCQWPSNLGFELAESIMRSNNMSKKSTKPVKKWQKASVQTLRIIQADQHIQMSPFTWL